MDARVPMNPGRLALALLLCAAAGAEERSPRLSLESALREARAANARLPVPALDVDVAREKIREARAELRLKVSMEGDFVFDPASGYDPILTNFGEERLQLVGQQHLFDGGGRRAAVSRAEAGLMAAGARYRIAELDLDLEVKNRFAGILEADAEIEVRSEGLERLRSYRTSLKSRQASGQGVAADLLKTDVRIASEEADLAEAERRGNEGRAALGDILGRDPSAPLELEPLPPPEKPLASGPEPWARAPELAEAEAESRSAEADVRAARSERRPHVFASANVGLWGSDTTHFIPPDLAQSTPGAGFFDRLKRDKGYSVSLNLSWPLWDFGGMKARLAQATLSLRQAQQGEQVQRRHARLEWQQALAARVSVLRQIEILSRAAPDARDAYLEAESRYRGGAATSLEVLEAHAVSVDAAVRLADAVMRYRAAEALQARWGTP